MGIRIYFFCGIMFKGYGVMSGCCVVFWWRGRILFFFLFRGFFILWVEIVRVGGKIIFMIIMVICKVEVELDFVCFNDFLGWYFYLFVVFVFFSFVFSIVMSLLLLVFFNFYLVLVVIVFGDWIGMRKINK